MEAASDTFLGFPLKDGESELGHFHLALSLMSHSLTYIFLLRVIQHKYIP